MQRLVNSFRRGRKPPLQDGQREAHCACTLIILERFGAIKLLAYLVGDFLVELRFGAGQFVGHSVGETLREQRCAVKFE